MKPSSRPSVDAAREDRPGYGMPGLAPGTQGVGAVTVRLADVTPERVDWQWKGRLPRGKIVTLDGDPGVGKSTLAVEWAARVSTGCPWPDGAGNRVGSVLLLSAEDGLADTIRPRLDAAGGDPAKVYALTEIRCEPQGHHQIRSRPVTLSDLVEIEDAVKRTGAVLVIVDVLMAFLPGKVDSHRDQDVRGVMSGLAAMAERRGCCVLLLRHLNKSTGGPAMYRGGGSIGIIGAARVGLVAAHSPEDEGRLILAGIKSNLAVMPEALAYQLVDSAEHGCARVEWLGPAAHTAAALLGGPRGQGRRPERDPGLDFLTRFLTERGGEAKSEEVFAAGNSEGHSTRTLQRAMGGAANIEAVRRGYQAPTVWRLTNPAAASPDLQLANGGATGQSGATVETLGLHRTSDDQSRQSRQSGQSASSGRSLSEETATEPPDRSALTLPNENRCCRDCGKPNLFHPASIARGICAGCVRRQGGSHDQ
jgi:hypothetical protein